MVSSLKIGLTRTWEKVLILFGALYVLLPTSPLNMQYSGRDSGVFLYVGWRILNGEIPYRDVWDHKPPIVFYINALGLRLSGGSRWGVWFIELVGLIIAIALGYYLIKKNFGTIPAILSAALWVSALPTMIEGGNLTEEYALPLQFAALWLILDTERSHPQNWRNFAIGVTGAAAFLTKQTSIGVWLAIAIYLIINRLRAYQPARLARELGLIALGSLAVVIPVIIFFASQDALSQFWDAAFRYNFVYSSYKTSLIKHFGAPIFIGIQHFGRSGLLTISTIGYLCALILIVVKKHEFGKFLPLFLIGLIDFPIEFLLVSASGQIYAHYYMILLPVMALFSGLIFWFIHTQLGEEELPRKARVFFTIGVVTIILWTTAFDYVYLASKYHAINSMMIDYLKTKTSPNDFVLMWGAETSANFFAQRKSPSRFVYQYPLYTEGYVDEQMIDGFLDDILRNKPLYIIDSKNPQTPFFEFLIRSDELDRKIAAIQANYRIVNVIGQWEIYKFKEQSP